MTPHIKAAACTIALFGFIFLIWFLPEKWLEIAAIIFTSALGILVVYGIYMLFFVYFSGGSIEIGRMDVD